MWEYNNIDQPLQDVGWKIHISCSLRNYGLLYKRIHELNDTVLRHLRWKIVEDKKAYFILNSIQTPRENAGKICTIYPNSLDEGLMLSYKLRDLLKDLDKGPRILTDYRLEDSQIHMRYGSFKELYYLDENGNSQCGKMDPKLHRTVPDRRNIFPDPHDNPFVENNSKKYDPFPFRVLNAIKFSNSGGIYVATKNEKNIF